MLSKAYKTLGLLRRTFSRQHLPEVKKKLYLSLVRSQFIFCSIIWRPHLIKDIKTIEQLQRRATKFILNDYESDYYDRLLKLNLLPIMYTFELADIIFAIKSLKVPSSNFNISNVLSFTVGNTRSAAQRKLKHVTVLNNKVRHFYFRRLSRLWNALPLLTSPYRSPQSDRRFTSFCGRILKQTSNLITPAVITSCAHATNAPTFPIPPTLSNKFI